MGSASGSRRVGNLAASTRWLGAISSLPVEIGERARDLDQAIDRARGQRPVAFDDLREHGSSSLLSSGQVARITDVRHLGVAADAERCEAVRAGARAPRRRARACAPTARRGSIERSSVSVTGWTWTWRSIRSSSGPDSRAAIAFDRARDCTCIRVRSSRASRTDTGSPRRPAGTTRAGATCRRSG